MRSCLGVTPIMGLKAHLALVLLAVQHRPEDIGCRFNFNSSIRRTRLQNFMKDN
jgi:hypothetical protein